MSRKEVKPMTPQEIASETRRVLKRMKEEGITLQQATGISDAFLEEMYSLAHAHYERGNYKESLSLFQFLGGCAPKTYKYMLGLAATLHQMGNYQEALNGFTVALQLDESNPLPIYYIADCFSRLGKEKEAIPLYEMMVKTAELAPQYAELAERSRLIVENYKAKTKHK